MLQNPVQTCSQMQGWFNTNEKYQNDISKYVNLAPPALTLLFKTLTLTAKLQTLNLIKKKVINKIHFISKQFLDIFNMLYAASYNLLLVYIKK